MDRSILTLPPPPADLRLAYGSHPLQFGDLRLPAGPDPHPLAVVIHGGFWRAHYDLLHAGHECAALTAAGIATWNIEYRRLGNGGGWPLTFQDVGAAVDHVRQLAFEYPLDLDRVVTVGHSAGGQLALWLTGRRRLSENAPLWTPEPLQLRAAISLAGVVDLRRAWELRLGDGVVEELMGGSPAEVPERYAVTSPAELVPLGVHQVLIHGTRDDPVPFEFSEQYWEQASAAGDDATLVTLAGAGHFEPIDPRSTEWPQVLDIVVQALAAS